MKTVRVFNKTKNCALAQRAEIADTPFSRIKGLLGRDALKEGEGLIIKPCNSIHTFFMRFSIDVVFLNKNNQIVALVSSLEPARFFSAVFKGKFAIELPSGILSQTGTTKGDLLRIE